MAAIAMMASLYSPATRRTSQRLMQCSVSASMTLSYALLKLL